ncbi:CIC11C00000005229 [Sungouiella intermedia]|uniref:CIC11C00000005229 n=1 Tax=Sungouiella intermedia TaxID=45354 RepID=A0A1L0G8V0_9ASCO|nr:CIC11C00000005229 [[Candida] intermedia]
MSYTFNVSYNKVNKKVTCARSATINDLALASMAKFAVSLSKNGSLSSSGKKLDGLLPIRLSNLVNNAKLELSVTGGDVEITLKVVASIGDESITKIVKLASSATLAALVEAFRASAGIGADWSEKRVQLSVLQANKDNLTSDFSQISVSNVVGSATNAVMRLLVENKDAQQKRAKLQEEQRVLRQQLEEQRRQERLLKKEEEHRLVESKDAEHERMDIDSEVENSDGIERNQIDKIGADRVKTVEKEEKPLSNSEVSSSLNRFDSTTPSATASGSVSGSLPAPVFQVPEEKEDTLYVPHSRSAIYENPEEDYNMTFGQAEKYYKIIKSMQGAANTKKEAVEIHKYVIRIRFPDRSLLDLPLEDPSLKLGQLLKKIDGYVAEKFINTYKLKNGLPPFKEIAVGFSQNNISLKSHPDFQLEKILLIWEPAEKNSKGPYLKEGIATKDASELPTLQLETHRGELDMDEVSAPKPVVNTDGKKKLSRMPKWFKK